MAVMSPNQLRTWRPEGFTKVASMIGSQMKVAGAVLTAVSAIGPLTKFGGKAASAESAQTQAMMQRLTQGITAGNALMAPLNETCAKLTAAQAMLRAQDQTAANFMLIVNPTSGYYNKPIPPPDPTPAGQTWYATQLATWAAVNGQITAIMAQVNVADHGGWAEMISAGAGLAAAAATLYSAFAGPKGGGGEDPPKDPPTPNPKDPPGNLTGGGGGGGGGLAGVGDLTPVAAQPMASSAAAVAARAALAAAGGAGAATAGMGGFMVPPMMGAGRGEDERRSGTAWRVTEDDDDIFAALPDPTGGVLT